MEKDIKFDDIVSMSPWEVYDMYYEDVIERSLLEAYSAYHNKQKKAVIVQKIIDSGKQVLYPTKQFGQEAVKYSLDGKHYKDAMLQAAVDVGENEEWLNAVKGKDFKYTKDALDYVKDHPQRKIMEANDTWDQPSLRKTTSVSVLTKSVGKAKKRSDKLEQVLEANKKLEAELKEFKAVQEMHGEEIKHIKSVAGLDDKVKVSILRSKGLNAPQIIEITGFSRSKVYRLLKELSGTKRDKS